MLGKVWPAVYTTNVSNVTMTGASMCVVAVARGTVALPVARFGTLTRQLSEPHNL